MVVDEGNVDGEEGEGVEVVDPPLVAPQSPGPPVRYRPEGGGDPLVSLGAGAGLCGGSTRFFLLRT